MSVKHSRSALRRVRHARVRARVLGTVKRPRLSVFRSAKHLAVQLIDDESSRTLLGLSEVHLGKEAQLPKGTVNPGVARAFALGKVLARRAGERGISTVVFDRGGYAYHGQVKAVAEGAREGGLKF